MEIPRIGGPHKLDLLLPVEVLARDAAHQRVSADALIGLPVTLETILLIKRNNGSLTYQRSNEKESSLLGFAAAGSE